MVSKVKSHVAAVQGYLLGALGAITYGTNPLFAKPLYADGMDAASVLFYRYVIAVALFAVVMRLRGDSFKLQLSQLPMAALLGALFALSSVLLFESYNYMDVGIASTMLFVGPVYIVLILRAFFGERISLVSVVSILVAMGGIALLCSPGEGANVTALGVILVLGSALSYAIYMIMVNKSRLRCLPGTTVTFYSLLLGIWVFGVPLDFYRDLQPVPPTLLAWGCVAGISIFPTIISLLCVTVAIHKIGSVPVSILGALEPVVGVIVGAAVFGEILTGRVLAGIAFVLLSVIVLVSGAYRGR